MQTHKRKNEPTSPPDIQGDLQIHKHVQALEKSLLTLCTHNVWTLVTRIFIMYHQGIRGSVLQNLLASSCSSPSDLSWKEYKGPLSGKGSEKTRAEAICLCEEAVGKHNHCYKGC